jgi:hypothetical protein
MRHKGTKRDDLQRRDAHGNWQQCNSLTITDRLENQAKAINDQKLNKELRRREKVEINYIYS